MSNNIGKKLIKIEDGVQIQVNDSEVVVTGAKGSLTARIPEGVEIEITDGSAKIKRAVKDPNSGKYAGLIRAILFNMVEGVSKGFKKDLELSGVGYRAKVEGRDLVLNVGFANAVRISPPEGITIAVSENTISVSGIDKALIGDIASKIREVRIPDPYKAKGIKYAGEKIRRKVGKAAKAVGGK
jgi:large subunit ribosomal protein L6